MPTDQNLHAVIDLALKDAVFQELRGAWDAKQTRGNITGLPDEAKAYVLSALLSNGASTYSATPEARPCRVVLFVEDELKARRWYDDLSFWLPDLRVSLFPSRELQIAEAAAIDRSQERTRLRILSDILHGQIDVLLVTAPALLQSLPPVHELEASSRNYRTDDIVEADELRERLSHLGYTYAQRADAPGQFAARGDIVDFVPPALPGEEGAGIRISFFDVEIDQIRSYDLDTQRSLEVLDKFSLSPLREIALDVIEREELSAKIEAQGHEAKRQCLRRGGSREAGEAFLDLYRHDAQRVRENLSFPAIDRYLSLMERATLFDYLNAQVALFPNAQKPLFLIDEPAHVWKRMDQATADFKFRAKELWERQAAPIEALESSLNPGKLRRSIDRNPRLWGFTTLLSGMQGIVDAETLNFFIHTADSYRANEERLHETVLEQLDLGAQVLLMAASEDRVERLKESFPQARSNPELSIREGQIGGGFHYPGAGLLVLTGQEIFGSERRRSRKRRPKSEHAGETIDFFTDLKIGDYVVHEAHGIGVYEGLQTLALGGGKRDYLQLRYAKGDVLYVPINDLQEIRKYIGAGAAQRPRLSRLGGGDWETLKNRARSSIRELATDIVGLYAKRREIKGHAFAAETPWEQEFAMGFPYEETEDQLRSIEEIYRDMESPRVMDRLLCGDVGFGKTEVAFRAIFKCIGDGKQAALLSPTTVLVQQHYENLKARCEGFPVEVRSLSRFVSPKEQRQTLKDLVSGKVDVVIGTHRLLSKDIEFRDLGLLVVDEEQRFGVDHKETIKEKYPRVDVLSLSATPIPRTLHMALSGIRDISIIDDPPVDRRPVQTYVMAWDPVLVEEAIRRELDRQGQVFFLYNNTHTIQQVAAKLRKRIPGLRVSVAHGQMPESQLEEVMEGFIEGEGDVLLCTTIIENGIDLPRVNTLIVTNADHLGLSQLYQLKGRVGRSWRQAYAYFTFDKNKVLNEDAEKRLTALREFTELGSGLKIALQDLEVRGAGNLLGGEQHGQMEAVGYDLYCRMLDEEIQAMKEELGEDVAPMDEKQREEERHVEKKAKVRLLARSSELQDAVNAAREQEGLSRHEHPGATVEFSVDAWFPASYIPDEGGRMDIYRRISRIQDLEDYYAIYDELLDRFGEPAPNQKALLDIAYIKSRAEALGVLSLRPKEREVRLDFGDGRFLNMPAMGLLLNLPGWKDRLFFHAGQTPYLILYNMSLDPVAQLEELQSLFAALERMIYPKKTH